MIALHACMPRSAGCGRTGSERPNRNIPNAIAGIVRYRLNAICRIIIVVYDKESCTQFYYNGSTNNVMIRISQQKEDLTKLSPDLSYFNDMCHFSLLLMLN